MMEPPERRFEILHAIWREETGQVLPCKRQHVEQWARLTLEVEPDRLGITMEKAILLVARRIKRLIRENPRCTGWQCHLSFWYFTKTENFRDTHLASALAEARKPKMPYGLREVLVATGRSVEVAASEPISAQVAYERTKLSEMLRQYQKDNPV